MSSTVPATANPRRERNPASEAMTVTQCNPCL
jgi:hypothetical protein